MFQIQASREFRRQPAKYIQAGTSAETAATPTKPVRMGRIIFSGSETGMSQRVGIIPAKKTILTASMMIGMVFSTGCFGLDFFARCFLIFRIFPLGLPCRPYMVVSLLLA